MLGDLPAKLTQGREEFRKGVKMDKEECKSFRDLVAIAEGKMKAPKEQEFNSLSATEKRDMAEVGKILSGFCENKTEENFLKMIYFSHNKDLRTCSVSSHTFEQVFQQTQTDIGGEEPSWITKPVPEGPCGIVQLSRFEPEKSGSSGFVFWKYIARKAITNPKGTDTFGQSCKGWDEKEYLYDWREKERALNCEYINFGAF